MFQHFISVRNCEGKKSSKCFRPFAPKSFKEEMFFNGMEWM